MAVEIRQSRYFMRQLKRLARKYPSLLTDIAQLGEQLLSEPRLGTPLGNSCYKIRLAVKSKGQGKSGGMRALTYVVVQLARAAGQAEVVYLASIYDKSERENLPDHELKEIVQELKDDEAHPA